MQKSITIELVKARESTGDLEVREKKKEVGCATNEERLLNDAEWRQRREYFAVIKYVHEFTLHDALPSCLCSLSLARVSSQPFESRNRVTVPHQSIAPRLIFVTITNLQGRTHENGCLHY